jgi:hypothetical protein
MTVLLKLCSNLNIGHRIHERNTISMEMLPVRLVEETHLAKLCPAKLPLHRVFQPFRRKPSRRPWMFRISVEVHRTSIQTMINDVLHR